MNRTILRTSSAMPQLTLLSDGAKSIGLSPSKPKASSSQPARRNLSAVAKKGPDPNLMLLHHEENVAAAFKTKRKAEEAGNELHMRDAEEQPKGMPAGKKREGSEEPEGGGVAGREAKRHKNAYEIREFLQASAPMPQCVVVSSSPRGASRMLIISRWKGRYCRSSRGGGRQPTSGAVDEAATGGRQETGGKGRISGVLDAHGGHAKWVDSKHRAAPMLISSSRGQHSPCSCFLVRESTRSTPSLLVRPLARRL